MGCRETTAARSYLAHIIAIAGEANQIFRPTSIFDFGIDGEVEFKDNDGKASGKRIYIQLKSGNSVSVIRSAVGCARHWHATGAVKV